MPLQWIRHRPFGNHCCIVIDREVRVTTIEWLAAGAFGQVFHRTDLSHSGTLNVSLAYTHTAILASVGIHGKSIVILIMQQVSNSHFVGARERKKVVVPEISNGIVKLPPLIPNRRSWLVGSSETVHPQCLIWFGLIRLICIEIPYPRQFLSLCKQLRHLQLARQ